MSPTRILPLYLMLTLGLGGIFWWLIIAAGTMRAAHGLYVIGVMWSPGTAAILSCLLTGTKLATLGWRIRPVKYLALAYATPLLFCAAGYGVIWASGLGGVPNLVTIALVQSRFGFQGYSTFATIAVYIGIILTLGTLNGTFTGLGEEIGWRGLMSPLLAKRFGFTNGALVTGAIWAAWHMPLMLFADYDTATPFWFAFPCFLIEVIGLSVIMLWLRLRSGSLWTAALLHGSANLFNQDLFAPLTAPRGAITAYAIDESGFMLPIVITITALLYWRRRAAVEHSPA